MIIVFQRTPEQICKIQKWMILYCFQEKQTNLVPENLLWCFCLSTVIKAYLLSILMTVQEADYILQMILLLLHFRAKKFILGSWRKRWSFIFSQNMRSIIIRSCSLKTCISEYVKYHSVTLLVNPLCWIRLKHFRFEEIYVSGTVETKMASQNCRMVEVGSDF